MNFSIIYRHFGGLMKLIINWWRDRCIIGRPNSNNPEHFRSDSDHQNLWLNLECPQKRFVVLQFSTKYFQINELWIQESIRTLFPVLAAEIK